MRNNLLIYTDPTGYASTAFDASEGFWPAGGMPQYDGLSLHSWRTTPDSFFTLGTYTLHGTYAPFDSSRSWGLDSFGGDRFGPSTLTVLGGWDSFHSASSDDVLMVPEVHVTGVRPMPSVPLSGWDWAQQGLGLAEAVPYPFVSTPAGLLNAGISTMRGHYGEAGWSALAAVPFVGTIGKYGRGTDAVLEHLTSILKPGGKLIGEVGS